MQIAERGVHPYPLDKGNFSYNWGSILGQPNPRNAR